MSEDYPRMIYALLRQTNDDTGNGMANIISRVAKAEGLDPKSFVDIWTEYTGREKEDLKVDLNDRYSYRERQVIKEILNER